MAHRFIVGEDPACAVGLLESFGSTGVANSVDLLGEATVTAGEADRYAGRCSTALEQLTERPAGGHPGPILEEDSGGPIPRTNVSVKVSALTPLLRPEPRMRDGATRGTVARSAALARGGGCHIHVDMESLDSRETVMELVLELLALPDLRSGPSVGLVVQAYLRDSGHATRGDPGLGRPPDRALPLTVRLVKGAYWDHELVEARQEGWPLPCMRSRATVTGTSRRSRAFCSRPGPRSGWQWPHTTCVPSPTPSPITACVVAAKAISSCRCCAGWATIFRTLWPLAGSGSAPTARWATWWPGWPTLSGGCLRTPPTRASCRAGWGRAARAAAGRAMSLEAFANEPVLELRRAAVRVRLEQALERLDAELPLSVPVCVGEDERRAEDLHFHRSRSARPARGRCGGRHRPRGG